MAVTKALSDENRVRIMMFLSEDELCVCQIIELLGLAPSTVSKHLSILKQAELIDSKKKGRWIYYYLPDEGVPEIVTQAIEWLQTSLNKDKQIQGDRKQLKKVQKKSLEELCQAYVNGNREAA
ncbi:MAG: winged helix-turn-helix transcriptional regulator [Candidatus Omnitrophica bacterium]|nr:winged helix-turn-helix transcriptional regulator [Candidatus Omnitrophota bacterium]MCA9425369.1 winged helix-turn-helix transcriptional regulator [Candidatus Omnitrophota bacterium]MCA9431187.1 winged helix-turn-helix transcriptional regulator [Candidatus Omnitrophota bacterium]MCA9442181.1 winged helix-turn-helix transcriptional regulator [Candidatus Omnitrophota bacterium]MCB9769417.1 winged helix-turn-helix transcriptional regulator [Candidatus Omnitrophota bacterium]